MSHFTAPEDFDTDEATRWCVWPKCQLKAWTEGWLPICKIHAVLTSRRVTEENISEEEAMLRWLEAERWTSVRETRSVVYYLRLEPTVIKIGVTTNLKARVHSLYSDLDSILALEYGERDLEQRRHLDFRDERIYANREKFHLTKKLRDHIVQLQPGAPKILAEVL